MRSLHILFMVLLPAMAFAGNIDMKDINSEVVNYKPYEALSEFPPPTISIFDPIPGDIKKQAMERMILPVINKCPIPVSAINLDAEGNDLHVDIYWADGSYTHSLVPREDNGDVRVDAYTSVWFHCETDVEY